MYTSMLQCMMLLVVLSNCLLICVPVIMFRTLFKVLFKNTAIHILFSIIYHSCDFFVFINIDTQSTQSSLLIADKWQ